jgi:hypothetical protein
LPRDALIDTPSAARLAMNDRPTAHLSDGVGDRVAVLPRG